MDEGSIAPVSTTRLISTDACRALLAYAAPDSMSVSVRLWTEGSGFAGAESDFTEPDGVDDWAVAGNDQGQAFFAWTASTSGAAGTASLRAMRRSVQVYRYLGRYTHRVAISNSRLVSATDETVTFRTRGDQTATLPPLVFLSRFLQHVLPHGFVTIRHYGLLASGDVTTRLERARVLLGGDDSQRDDPPTDQKETDEPWPELLAAVAARRRHPLPRCGAHAVQRGRLPSHLPSGARAPRQVAA